MAASRDLLIGAEVPDAEHDRTHLHIGARAERATINRFALAMAIFLAPLLLLVIAFEAFLWFVGETWPLERVIRYQEKHPQAFYSRAVIDQGTFRYKYLQILRRHPRILVLGSSRVMQFRSEMFGSQAPSFYNAGGMIHSIEDLNDFLDRFPPEAWPKIMLVGIDFWWLNADEKKEPNDAFIVGVNEDGAYSWQGHAHVFAYYLQQPRMLGRPLAQCFSKHRERNAIGIQALIHHSGFRLDGSKYFELKVPKTTEGWAQRLPTRKAVEKGILDGKFPFAFTDGVSKTRLEMLRQTLQKLKERGVFVIAYSPPIIKAWADVASIAPHQHQFWKEYHEQLPALFDSLGIPFLDIVTTDQIGLDDRYMRDPYHAYDTFDLYVLRRLCDLPGVQGTFTDVPAIADKSLSSAKTNPLHLDLAGGE